MDTPEANALPVGLDQVSALHADETILSRGNVVQERVIGRRGRGGAMVHYVRL
jgi:hypothetical protein